MIRVWRIFVASVALSLGLSVLGRAADAGALEDIANLVPFWQSHAPLCEGWPSSQNCEDGDMTMFSALLCASGEQLGCDAVKAAQDSTGRWHRSPRLAANPALRSGDSFSWDMALGVQLYAAVTGDHGAFARWLTWVENNRPCLVEIPLDGIHCAARGWPRWCTDDTEKGCTARPQDLATLAMTTAAMNITLPPVADVPLPGGLAGIAVAAAKEAAAPTHQALSLAELIERARDLQPMILLIDANVNSAGYPRNLTGVTVMLFRKLGLTNNAAVDRVAAILAIKQPNNPFFQLLRDGPTEDVAQRVLALAPQSEAALPAELADWAWQRDTSEEAWKRSNLWDFVFIGRLLGGAS